MNPAGRRQNNKVRPVISITDNLWSWIEHWERMDVDDEGEPLNIGRWIHWEQEAISDVRKGFYAHRDATDLVNGEEVRRYPQVLTRYAIRHLMTTVVIRAGVPVEPRERWLGHIQE